MKQNSVSERLVNGIVLENPTFVLMLGNVPDPGCNNVSHQRSWYGTYHHGGSGTQQYVYFHAAEYYSG